MINDILKTYYGIKEVEGIGFSPTILKWVNKYYPNVKDDDEIPNCSICLIECFKEFGKSALVKECTPAAISWNSVGFPVSLEEAKFNDIVILKRTGGHHVGLFVRYSKVQKLVYILGFNQNNQCNISSYSITQIKEIRRYDESDEIS